MHSPIPSVLGRLLAELSWEGRKIVSYRQGGRGFENVLTTEVLQALDFLPRNSFLGSVLRSAHCDSAPHLNALCQEVEQAQISLLPGDMMLSGDGLRPINVQPDAIVSSPSVYCIVEAKRILNSSFQPLQLAREFVLAHHHAGGRRPLLLLVLSTPPPVKIQGKGRLSIEQAILQSLPEVFTPGADQTPWTTQIASTVAWLTWTEVAATVAREMAEFSSGTASVDASIQRICQVLLEAIRWHGDIPITGTSHSG